MAADWWRFQTCHLPCVRESASVCSDMTCMLIPATRAPGAWYLFAGGHARQRFPSARPVGSLRQLLPDFSHRGEPSRPRAARPIRPERRGQRSGGEPFGRTQALTSSSTCADFTAQGAGIGRNSPQQRALPAVSFFPSPTESMIWLKNWISFRRIVPRCSCMLALAKRQFR